MRFFVLVVAALVGSSGCAQAQSPGTLIPRLEELAQQGNGEALYHLGMAYWTGTGAGKDTDKALAYFEKAAAAGDPLGAYKLGCLHDGQDGVLDRDAAKALEYKLIAANAGYALAQQDVAALYAERKDFQSALKWIERAAKQGTSGALMTFASIHNGAPGIRPDPVVTAAYFRLFLNRTDGNGEQQTWLETFEQRLTPQQRADARKIVAAYRPAPTTLTVKALRGAEAAKDLVASN